MTETSEIQVVYRPQGSQEYYIGCNGTRHYFVTDLRKKKFDVGECCCIEEAKS